MNIREYASGTISTNYDSGWYNEKGENSSDGATRNRWVVQVSWQNGSGSANTDKIQFAGTIAGGEDVLKEATMSDHGTASSGIITFNVDVPINALKIKFVQDGITDLELKIDYDVIRL